MNSAGTCHLGQLYSTGYLTYQCEKTSGIMKVLGIGECRNMRFMEYAFIM